MTNFVVVCGQMFAGDIKFPIAVRMAAFVYIHWYDSIDIIQGALTKKFDLFPVAIMYNARKDFLLFVFLPVLQYMQFSFAVDDRI